MECVPNISEGSDGETLDAIAAAIEGHAGTWLLDRTADPDHGRSVFTIAGYPGRVMAAMEAALAVAVERIDMREQQGRHPRLGLRRRHPLRAARGHHHGTVRRSVRASSPGASPTASNCRSTSMHEAAQAARASHPGRNPAAGLRGSCRDDGPAGRRAGLRAHAPTSHGRRHRGRGSAIPDRLQHPALHDRRQRGSTHRRPHPGTRWWPAGRAGPGHRSRISGLCPAIDEHPRSPANAALARLGGGRAPGR